MATLHDVWRRGVASHEEGVDAATAPGPADDIWVAEIQRTLISLLAMCSDGGDHMANESKSPVLEGRADDLWSGGREAGG